MNIVFIAPWSLSDPLSISTVIPHVIDLSSRNSVDNIFLVTTEFRPSLDASRSLSDSLPPNVVFFPFVSSSTGPFQYFVSDFQRFMFVYRLVKNRDINFLVCRGSSVGIYGHRLKVLLNVDYIVESFEPHADYMRQSGVWKPWSFKYLIQRHWEKQIKKTASFLITVSHAYARYLSKVERISSARLLTLPCWADPNKYRLDPLARASIRSELGVRDRICLIYVGKFGGLYSPPSILSVLAMIEKCLELELFFVCLTPSDPSPVLDQLDALNFTEDRRIVKKVHPCDVPAYLNAADIAIDFWFSGPWSFACSPIKHAEYWMAGLPVLMRHNIGDESSWLEALAVGSIVDFEDCQSVNRSVQFVKSILNDDHHKERIRSVAEKRRGPSLLRPIYGKIFGS